MKKWATLLLMIAFNSMLLAQNEAVASWYAEPLP